MNRMMGYNNRNFLDSNSNQDKSITHHNQTKVLTAWFLNLPLDEYIDNTKAQSLNFKSKTHEAQLEDQKPKKAQEDHLEEGENRKTNKWHEKRKTKEKAEKSSNSKLKLKIPPKQTQGKLSPLGRHYHVSSLNHPVSKEFNQLCAYSLPIWQ
jgi:hypothetical protein